jgi:glycosyltransferase involved in cell wall biosynthesis
MGIDADEQRDRWRVRIAACVACRNEAIALPVMLESLRTQEWPADADVRFTILDDASSDATPEIAAKVALEDGRFRTHRFEQRVGQTQAIEWFVRHTDADCLISLDADIRFAHADVLWRLSSTIVGGTDLASLRSVALAPRSFWERGGVYLVDLLNYVKDRWTPESTIYVCNGRAIAYGPKMVAALRSIEWPAMPHAADLFAFAVAKQSGLRYQLVNDAVVLHRATATPRELAGQFVRAARDIREMRRRFGDKLMDKMAIPPGLAVRAVLGTTTRDPVGAVSWSMQRAYAIMKSFRDDKRWGTTTTTKDIS